MVAGRSTGVREDEFYEGPQRHIQTPLPQPPSTSRCQGYTFHSALWKIRGIALWKVYPLEARCGRAVEDVCGTMLIIVCMALMALFMLTTVFIIIIHDKKGPVPKWVRTVFLKYLARSLLKEARVGAVRMSTGRLFQAVGPR
ncbi:hypothetical protein Bbelb_100560 [Branchiostoma belcheri]|nr:hypothetical protein Bbelb_100560 [Branchiostoma belcheri]